MVEQCSTLKTLSFEVSLDERDDAGDRTIITFPTALPTASLENLTIENRGKVTSRQLTRFLKLLIKVPGVAQLKTLTIVDADDWRDLGEFVLAEAWSLQGLKLVLEPEPVPRVRREGAVDSDESEESEDEDDDEEDGEEEENDDVK